MDIVSVSEGFTVVMTFKGGIDGKIMNLFIIFKNRDSSYPIQNAPGNIPHVSYRSNPTAFMKTMLFDKAQDIIRREQSSSSYYRSASSRQSENANCGIERICSSLFCTKF
jgi:hypothetical protein